MRNQARIVHPCLRITQIGFQEAGPQRRIRKFGFQEAAPHRNPLFLHPLAPLPRRRRTTDPKPSLEPCNEYNRCLLLFRHNSRPGRGWDNSRRGHIRRCRRCRRPLSVRPAHICYLGVFICLLYIGEQSKFKIFVLVRPSVYSGSCNISTINIIYII